MKKTLFGLVSNESTIPHLMERLAAAHVCDISLFKMQANRGATLAEASLGSMDEQRHAGDAQHHKYADKPTDCHVKHREAESRHFEAFQAAEGCEAQALAGGMQLLELPGLGLCQCSGTIQQELRAAAAKSTSECKSTLCAALLSQGMAEHEAHYFEAQIMAGLVLICMHALHSEDLNCAHEILKKEGIKEMTFSREKARAH